MTRTSKTILNDNDENEHPFFVPELRGSTFRFLPLSLILAGASLVAQQ